MRDKLSFGTDGQQMVRQLATCREVAKPVTQLALDVEKGVVYTWVVASREGLTIAPEVHVIPLPAFVQFAASVFAQYARLFGPAIPAPLVTSPPRVM